MKKSIICMILLAISIGLCAQGFDKKSVVSNKKVVSVIGGNVELWNHISISDTTYTIRLKDHHLRRLNDFVNLKFQNKASVVDFLDKVIYQYSEMKVGDSFDLGLGTGNTGVCKSILGIKVLAITGELDMFGYLDKKHAEKMLNYLKKL